MADTPTFQSNPYASFDPSQYTNPYSNFFGQPIQPPPGMTLNSTPQQPQAAAAPPQQQMGWNPGYLIDSRTGLPSQNGSGDRVGQGMFSFDPQTVAHLAPTVGNKAMFGAAVGGGQPGATAAPAQAAAPNNWQSTLSMLANPGHVTTPGATVPQAQSSTGVQPGVLQNFLANWKPQQSGAGSGFTQNFNSILRGLQA